MRKIKIAIRKRSVVPNASLIANKSIVKIYEGPKLAHLLGPVHINNFKSLFQNVNLALSVAVIAIIGTLS